MAKGGKNQSVKQMVAVIAVALLLVTGIYFFMEYQRTRPGTPISDVAISVTSAGDTREIPPYTVCELDQECDGGTPPSMPLGDDSVHVAVPKDIAQTSWRVLAIYDDPAANNETVYTSGEATEHEIDAVTESGATLVVAEVSALAIDHAADGEEVPVIATWSVGFE